MAISEPAQGWHHQDPPNMWPVLAGVSFLLHVAILGLALPLVIRLSQSESVTENDVTVPVEFVDVTEQAAQSGPQVTSPETDVPSEPSPTVSTETQSAVTDTTQSDETAIASANLNESTTSSDSNSVAPRSTAPQTAPEPSNLQPTPAPTTAPETNRQAAAPRPTPAPTNPSPTPQTAPQPTPQPTPQSTTPPQTPTPSEVTQPPTLPSSGPPLASPPEIASASRSAVFMSFVGFDQVPITVPGDRPDTYPELQDSPSDSIVLSAGEHDCGDLGVVSHQRIAVRVDISASGMILSAWPQSSPGSDFERHVACLLPHADFRFRPAQMDSRNVRTDMVILEVEIGPT